MIIYEKCSLITIRHDRQSSCGYVGILGCHRVLTAGEYLPYVVAGVFAFGSMERKWEGGGGGGKRSGEMEERVKRSTA